MLARQLRVGVLDAIEQRIKQFRAREELWPLRIPPEPIALDVIIRRAVPEAPSRFDVTSLRSRPLLRLEWEDGSAWEAWMIVLPSGFKVYCDSSEEESRILASGGRNEGDESDRAFLQLLAESGGAHFGIEMSGGPPSRVRATIDDREFLVDFFVELFEVIGAEEGVREQLSRPGRSTDFRADVDEWLTRALRPQRQV
jgi:hypothetical protein